MWLAVSRVHPRRQWYPAWASLAVPIKTHGEQCLFTGPDINILVKGRGVLIVNCRPSHHERTLDTLHILTRGSSQAVPVRGDTSPPS